MPKPEAASKLLLVEDDHVLRLLMQTALRTTGLAVYAVASVGEALQHVGGVDPPQIVITDLSLPDGNGLDILAQVRDLPVKPLIIVMTGNSSLETATAALRLGAFDYLTKPVNVDFLLAAVGRASENIQLRRTIDAMAREQAHKEAMRATALAAAHHLNQDLTVIIGEIQLLEESNIAPDEIRMVLERMAEAAQRATTTIRALQQARSFVTEAHGNDNVMLDLLAASTR